MWRDMANGPAIDDQRAVRINRPSSGIPVKPDPDEDVEQDPFDVVAAACPAKPDARNPILYDSESEGEY